LLPFPSWHAWWLVHRASVLSYARRALYKGAWGSITVPDADRPSTGCGGHGVRPVAFIIAKPADLLVGPGGSGLVIWGTSASLLVIGCIR